ncbi:hypothetical protein QTP88_028987 [Uroleucon formosanum]
MLSANIPLNKLSNTYFKQFLIKYTGQNIPDQTTLRKVNVDHCYQEVLNEIRQKVAGKKIWVSIDETTDAEGRFIASVIIGTLLLDRPGEFFLFNLEQLQKTNHSTICSLFENSLYLLWPDGIRRNDVLLFLSDAVPYMVKVGDTLKVLYPKMVHVTCSSHGLHRVAEQIRIQFPKVDKLVANVKRVFKKASYHVQKFHTDAPNISLPPEPILTRWGAWISAVLYYSENFQTVKNIIESFDENDALSIKNAMQNIKLQIAIIQDISSKFSQLTGTAGCDINKKLQTVLNKNKGFQIVCNISKILTGEEENVGDLDIAEDLTSSDMAYFKFAPITSADVERSFSLYKNILAPNRRTFKFENLKKSLIVQCNNYFRGSFLKFLSKEKDKLDSQSDVILATKISTISQVNSEAENLELEREKSPELSPICLKSPKALNKDSELPQIIISNFKESNSVEFQEILSC